MNMKKIFGAVVVTFVMAVIMCSFSVSAATMNGNANFRDEYNNIICLIGAGEYVEPTGNYAYINGEIAWDRTEVYYGGMRGSVLSERIGGYYDNYDNDDYYDTSCSGEEIWVDINISSQTVNLMQGSSCIYSQYCVTGTAGVHDTPTGTFYIQNKEMGRTLTGADYSAYVDYWMPFCGGVGLHDASWRSSFGGDIYTYAGSHGCVNVADAGTIYEYVSVGTRVEVHY